MKSIKFFLLSTLFLFTSNTLFATGTKLVLVNQYGEKSINQVTTGSDFVGSAVSANTIVSNITGSSAKPVGNTYAAVSAKLTPAMFLTGYVSGAGTVAASDTVLEAIQKLNGNIGVYSESAPSLTFDHSVGAKTITVRVVGKLVSLSIPAGAISDGLGTVCATTAGLAAGLRPSAAVTFSALVIDNGTTRKAGQLVVGSNGVLTFSVLGTGFTNAAAAGWDAVSVSYAIP